MRKLLLAGAIIAASVSAAHAEDWYIAHMGSEPCVPVAGIGDDFKRVYYGSGKMRTPLEVAAMFQRMGAIIQVSPIRKDGVFAFEAKAKGDWFTMVFFRDRDGCLDVMERIGK